ncbi:MAG: hypothetical protein U0903_09215 [Planctomycetales bacterium]
MTMPLKQLGLLLLIGFAFLAASVTQAADPPVAPKAEKKSREQLEQELSKTLSGCQLVGEFTVDGQPRDGNPKTEKYVITSATKLQGDMWLLVSRIQYGKKDLTLPLTLPIVWAGDTPVISLTDLTIPGLGTFSSRVLIYEGRYVGTWQHGAVGGAMFGRVEKLPPEKLPAEKPAGESAKPAAKESDTSKPAK